MRQYFQKDGIVIYYGDWREPIPTVERADCIITDPPYDETNLSWDKCDHFWLNEVWRENLLSPRGSIWVFGSFKYFLSLFDFIQHNENRFSHAQEVVWEKHNGSNAMADRFRRVHEFAVQLYDVRSQWSRIYKKPLFTFDGQKKAITRRQSPQHWSKLRASSYYTDLGGRRLVRSVVRMKSCHGEALWPTQKPLELVKMLAEYSCPPGGLIIDMHMGSGTTLAAAHDLGMRAIGIDRDKKACRIAAERLEYSS